MIVQPLTVQVLSINGFPVGTQSTEIEQVVKTWFDKLPEEMKKMVDRWHANGSRCTSAFMHLKPGYDIDDP